MKNLKKIEKIWLALKKSAPKVFFLYAQRKIYKLETELTTLRQRYLKEEDEKEKEIIKTQGLELKEELEILKNLIKDKDA